MHNIFLKETVLVSKQNAEMMKWMTLGEAAEQIIFIKSLNGSIE